MSVCMCIYKHLMHIWKIHIVQFFIEPKKQCPVESPHPQEESSLQRVFDPDTHTHALYDPLHISVLKKIYIHICMCTCVYVCGVYKRRSTTKRKKYKFTTRAQKEWHKKIHVLL